MAVNCVSIQLLQSRCTLVAAFRHPVRAPVLATAGDWLPLGKLSPKVTDEGNPRRSGQFPGIYADSLFVSSSLFPCPVASGGLLSRRGESRQRHAKGNRVVARGNGRYPAFGRIPARFPRLLLLKSKRLLRFEKDVSPESIRCWPIRLTPDIPANKDADSFPDDQGGSAPLDSPLLDEGRGYYGGRGIDRCGRNVGRGTGVWTGVADCHSRCAHRLRNDGKARLGA